MSNIVEFPNSRTQQTKANDGVWASHAERVQRSVSQLELQTRGMSEPDRLTLAKNLGELIEDRARDHGLGRAEALQKVWNRFDPNNDLWAKRLRYVRFRDEEKKGDILAGAGKQFVSLAQSVWAAMPTRGVAVERDLVEAHAKLLRGTAFDPDPMATARIDFDAARDLGALMEAAIKRTLVQVPELPEYFKRLEEHGLRHPDAEELPVHDKDARPMQPLDYLGWSMERFEAPAGRDVQWSLTASASNLREGFWFEDGVGVESVLPRIVLGRITVTTRVPFVHESSILDWGQSPDQQPQHSPDDLLSDGDLLKEFAAKADLVAILSSPPEHLHPSWTLPRDFTFEVQLVICPSEQNGGRGMCVGIFVRLPWSDASQGTKGTYIGGFEDFGVFRHDPSPDRVVMRNEIFGAGYRDAVRHILPPGRSFDTLCLIPGDAADQVLGLRHTAPINELHSQTATVSITIEPNFDSPAGFTPQPATSLGGMMIANLLYARGPANLVDRISADARSRVDRLEHQYRQWMTEYEAARNSFLDTSSQDDPA